MMSLKTDDLLQSLVEFIPRFQRLQRKLSPTTQSVLLALSEHSALNLTGLANFRDVKKSTMSVMMDQLTHQQLVIKARSKTDRRQHIYMLSRQGRDLLEQEWQFKQEWLAEQLSGYTQEQIDLCVSLLKSISYAGVNDGDTD